MSNEKEDRLNLNEVMPEDKKEYPRPEEKEDKKETNESKPING